MTISPNPFPSPESGLDEAVRGHLDTEAARMDARALWNGVLSRLEAQKFPPPARQWRRNSVRMAAALVALAAGVFLAAFFLPFGQAVSASPTAIILAARNAASDTRCYRVEIVLPPRSKEGLAGLALDGGERTLCTRGDRFVVQPGLGGKGAWGRDALGRIWVAPTKEAAVVFEENELPPPLRTAVKIHELELRTLLDDVLADFNVTWASPSADKGPLATLTAIRRGASWPFQITSVELSVEKQTNLIRSLTVHRALPGGAKATITFMLLAAVTKDERTFLPEGHVKDATHIYDHTMPVARRRLLLEQLGDALLKGP